MIENKIALPKVELPIGGGAVQGVANNFHTNAFSGSSAFSFPIPIPSARLTPSFSVGYSSSSGNGLLGAGFHLETPSISRKTSRGIPQYNWDKEDIFLLGGRELVFDTESGMYLEQHQTSFDRIERLDGQAWKVTTGDNAQFSYGTTPESRVQNVSDAPADKTASWKLAFEEDAHGNKVRYNYKRFSEFFPTGSLAKTVADHNTYLESINYSNYWTNRAKKEEDYAFKVVIDYGQIDIVETTRSGLLTKKSDLLPDTLRRKDVVRDFRFGFELTTDLLVRNILVFQYLPEQKQQILTTRVAFTYEDNSIMSVLQQIQTSKYRLGKNKKDGLTAKSVPPVTFAYTKFDASNRSVVYRAISDTNLGNLPVNFADVEGAGLPGVLHREAGTIRYFPPDGDAHYGKPKTQLNLPIGYADSNQPMTLTSLEGNGEQQLVTAQENHSGFYALERLDTWKHFKAFEHQQVNDAARQTEYADLTGDSRTDQIVFAADTVWFTPSLGKIGMGKRIALPNENAVPGPHTHDPFVYFGFANLFGDGLGHRIKLEHKKMTVWPCLGYGRFANAREIDIPDFDISTNQLDLSNRLHLIDFNGNGKTDIVLVDHGVIKVFLNENGTSFQAPFFIAFPEGQVFTNTDQIQFADITGNGVQELVFTKTGPDVKHYYFSTGDFVTSQLKGQLAKANLLETVSTNLGAKTDTLYKSSLHYYLRDRSGENPWYTKMYNPAIVVHKSIATDFISGTRLQSEYSYRDGYYDPRFHSFEGFGCVEHRDTPINSLYGNDSDDKLPVSVTKQWFHLGMGLDEAKVRKQFFQHQYAPRVPFQKDGGLVGQSRIEAYHALVGSEIHHEVWDAADLADGCPYQTHSACFTVTETKKPEKGRRGVYKVHSNESVALDFEKQAADPHMTQSCVLEVDEYLHTLTSCEIHYARKKPIIEEQNVTHILAHTSRFKNQDAKDKTRWLGVDLEDKAFEVLRHGYGAAYIDFDTICNDVREALNTQVAYSAPAVDKAYARLLTWEKHFYWASEKQKKTHPLDLPDIDNILLPAYGQFVEFDDAQVTQAYTSPYPQTKGKLLVSEAELKAAGYLKADHYWWNRSAKNYFHKDHFFQPYKATFDYEGIDAGSHLRSESEVTYDPLSLFPIESKVKYAAGKYLTTRSEIDYIGLHPWRVIDPNGNTAEALFDELGQVIATAQYSSDGSEGNLPLDKYVRKPVKSIAEVFENPLEYIQKAGSFFYYEFGHHKDGTWVPSCAVSLSSTAYKTEDLNHIQRGIVYNDAFGRVIEAKAYAGTGQMTFANKQQHDRWLASGRVEYNAKGQPWRQYLGYFADSWEHEYNWQQVIKCLLPKPTVLTYDALGRAVRTDTPKGFFTKVEFKSAWETRHFDVNDTVKDSPYYKSGAWKHDEDEKDAITKAVAFHNTPAISITDSLGHDVRSYELLKPIKPDTRVEELRPDDENVLVAWQSFDIQGRVLQQADPRFFEHNENPDRTEARRYNFVHIHPMAGHELRTHGSDSGTHIHFEDVQGNALKSWDALGYEHRVEYDHMHRPVKQYVNTHKGSADPERCVGQTIFGEAHPQAESLNLLGRAWKTWDTAGYYEIEGYTFEGHPLQSSFQYRTEYIKEVNWSRPESETLEQHRYTTCAKFDAAGRPFEKTEPDGSIVRWEYGIMGNCMRSTIQLEGKGSVREITTGSEIDANGHLRHVKLGNGLHTRYTYHTLTLNLTKITTGKGPVAAIQNLHYVHDPSGLITRLNNKNVEPFVHDGQLLSGTFDYTYDAIYQLTKASARTRQAATVFADPHQGKVFYRRAASNRDTKALSKYTRTYAYDKSHNLLLLKQTGGQPSARTFTIDATSNRILHYSCPAGRNSAKQQTLSYDAAGQQLALHNNGQPLVWNTHGNIASTTMVKRNDGEDDAEYYVYNGAGMRVRKVSVTRGANTKQLEDKRYLGDYKQILTFRNDPENADQDHRKITVTGVQKHDCMVEYYSTSTRVFGTRKKLPTSDSPMLRYQHSDVINSVGVETNAEGKVISYEEYTPFGETALAWTDTQLDISPKEYRYSAQEKDKSTGLYYYGHRYYSATLCRWTRPDPAGTVDGLNLYAMVGNEPVGRFDVMGLMPKGGAGSTPKKNTVRQSISKRKKNAKSQVIKTGKYILSKKKLQLKKGGQKFNKYGPVLAGKLLKHLTHKASAIVRHLNQGTTYKEWVINTQKQVSTTRDGSIRISKMKIKTGHGPMGRTVFVKPSGLGYHFTKNEGPQRSHSRGFTPRKKKNFSIDSTSVDTTRDRAKDKNNNLNNLMGNQGAGTFNIAYAENLHMIAYGLGGLNHKDNLIAGSHNLNTAMLAVEGVAIMGFQSNKLSKYSVRSYTKTVTDPISQVKKKWVKAVKITLEAGVRKSSILLQEYPNPAQKLYHDDFNEIKKWAKEFVYPTKK